MIKKLSLIIAFLLLSIFPLSSCNKNTTNKNEEEKYNYLLAEAGEITVPLTPFDSLDPLTTENLSYFYLCGLVYEGLYTLDKNYRPRPVLIQDEFVGDKTIRIRLKDGIVFHDGQNLRASDVVDSLNRIRTIGKGPYYNLIVNNITKKFALNARAIDDRTVEFTYDGDGPFLKEYLIFPVVKSDNVNLKTTMPSGTGPFKFASYENKKELNLERFDNYHDEISSIGKIKGIVHESEDLIYTSLETGRIKVSTAWDLNYFKFFNNDRFNAKTYLSNEMYFLFLNPSGVLQDAPLREAIYSSIDKDKIIKMALNDQAYPSTGFINPNSYFYRLNQDENSDDKAREILGDRHETINLYFYWNNEYHVKIATQLAEEFRGVGFKVNLVGSTNESFDDYKNNLKAGVYDIALVGMNTNLIPDYAYTINSILPYKSTAINEALSEITDAKDEEDLIKITNKIDLIIQHERIFVPLVYKVDALIYSNSIVGEIEPNAIFPYRTLRSAYFTTKQ